MITREDLDTIDDYWEIFCKKKNIIECDFEEISKDFALVILNLERENRYLRDLSSMEKSAESLQKILEEFKNESKN